MTLVSPLIEVVHMGGIGGLAIVIAFFICCFGVVCAAEAFLNRRKVKPAEPPKEARTWKVFIESPDGWPMRPLKLSEKSVGHILRDVDQGRLE